MISLLTQRQLQSHFIPPVKLKCTTLWIEPIVTSNLKNRIMISAWFSLELPKGWLAFHLMQPESISIIIRATRLNYWSLNFATKDKHRNDSSYNLTYRWLDITDFSHDYCRGVSEVMRSARSLWGSRLITEMASRAKCAIDEAWVSFMLSSRFVTAKYAAKNSY